MATALIRHQQLAGLDTQQKCWILYVERGLEQKQIAAELGITQAAVSKALKRCEQLGLEALKGRIEVHKVRTLDRYEWAYREARDAWERSKEGTSKKTQGETQGGKRIGKDPERKAEIEHTDTPGDPKYLIAAMKALDSIRKLLGLDAPVKIQAVDPLRPLAEMPTEDLYRETAQLLAKAGVSLETVLATGPKGPQ